MTDVHVAIGLSALTALVTLLGWPWIKAALDAADPDRHG